MGGGNSIMSTTDSVVDSISTTIINALQVSESKVRQQQSLKIQCTAYERLVEASISQCETNFKDRSAADIKTICSLNANAFPPCGADQVDMTQSLTTDSTNSQSINTVTSQTANLSATVQKNLSQTYGIGQFDNSMSSNTSSIISSVALLLSNESQTINTDIKQSQVIQADADIALINAAQVAYFISKIIQGDTALLSQVSDLSTNINEAIAQKNSAFNLQIGLIVGAVVFVIVIIIVLRLIFASHAKKNE